MTSAADYNAKQITTGQLTVDHITALVKHWQESTAGLVVDGKAGPKTIASIEEAMRPATAPFLASPLPKLPGGRVAEVTSEFRPTDRPDHDGIDMFYRWMPGDKPDFVGDGGCAGRLSDGSPKWVVPYGTPGSPPRRAGSPRPVTARPGTTSGSTMATAGGRAAGT